jgi:transglutaminase-like putative cysteine protease
VQLAQTPPPSVLMSLPEGASGVRETLKLMSALVKGGKKSPAVRTKALALTQHLRQKDRFGEIHALWDFVRNNIRYVRDIRNVETVHTPEQILRQESGDCDDKSLLLASLLESIGHPTAFWAIGTKPGKFSHVLVLTRVGPNKKWLPLETTEAVRIGWRPPVVEASMTHYN